MQVERVTEELLNQIFKDKGVVNGLEKALAYTNKSGLETIFGVYKRPFSELYYPASALTVGSPTSAGGNIGKNYARELFIRETGLDPDLDENIEDYVLFCLDKGLEEVEFGQVTPQKLGDYPLLNFHIRREGRRGPSNTSFHTIKNHMCMFPYSRPISCTVSNERDYPLFLMQAETNEWENIDFDFAKSLMVSAANGTDPISHLVLAGVLNSLRKEYDPFKRAFGNFQRQTGKFTFFPDIKRFCYEIKHEEENDGTRTAKNL